jgi:hypothetical protein
MRFNIGRSFAVGVFVLVAMTSRFASAQSVTAFPDTSRTTMLTAVVSEQAQMAIPQGWSASPWSNATPVSGTLSDAAYAAIAICEADAASCGSDDLVFTLAPKSTVTASGNHTLVVMWKFEIIGN